MVINTNIVAQSGAQMLASASSNLAKSIQRLSSGSRIVSPEDDAAGLAESMKFDGQSQRIGAAIRNLNNAISFSQTQDGFMQQVAKALNRMSELAVASQDVTKTNSDRSLYNNEYQQLANYINLVASKDFNGVSLFNAAGKAVTVDSDANTFTMTPIDLGTTTYTNATTSMSISSTGGAITALTNVRTALDRLASDRATVGASLARLNYTTTQLGVQKINIDSANSVIKDVDVAEESTSYARYNILVQSGTAMLAQANTMPQSVLKLLG